jgi:lipopolysaccharide export system protein LptA
MEYWEDKKIAVARGDAVAIRGDRHVEGDVLTAEFRDLPNGKSQLHIMTAEGHVVVITANDVSRGNHAVYDINRNIAVITGNVRITRADGTQLTGDVGEVDFAANQSRLLNEGKGRVRALLPSQEKQKPGVNQTMKPIASQTGGSGPQTAAATPTP